MDRHTIYSTMHSPNNTMDSCEGYQAPSTTKVLDQSLLEHASSTFETPEPGAFKHRGKCNRPQARCATKCAYQQHYFCPNDPKTTNLHQQHELANPKTCDRKRDKAKRFMSTKGPRIAGAAAAIGMFIFNVVSSCG